MINRKAPEGDYVRSIASFEFLDGALEGLRLLARQERPIIVITNQRGIARRLMSDDDLAAIHAHMLDAVADAGGRIDHIEYCPHELGTCDCRKPGTAMFERARRAFPEIEFSRSAMVGDGPADMEAASRIGARRILVAPGRTGPVPANADLVVDDLISAARELAG